MVTIIMKKVINTTYNFYEYNFYEYGDVDQHGSIAIMDEYNNIRYYFNTATMRIDYDEDIQVLCIQCAKTYMETITITYETPQEVTLLFFSLY